MREYFSGGIIIAAQTILAVKQDSMVLADFCITEVPACAEVGLQLGALAAAPADRAGVRVTGIEICAGRRRAGAEKILTRTICPNACPSPSNLREHRRAFARKRLTPSCPIRPTSPRHIRSHVGRDDTRAIAAQRRSAARSTISARARRMRCASAAISCLVHKPERLTDLLCTLRAHPAGGEAHPASCGHTRARNASLGVLLAARLGGKPGVTRWSRSCCSSRRTDRRPPKHGESITIGN